MPSQVIEIAMTHRAGAGGMAERVMRPESVREVATRVQRWAVVQEPCKSCLSLPAGRVSDGMALCGRCHAQRGQRFRIDPEGLKPTELRAEDPPTSDQELHGYTIRFNERSVELFGFYEYIRPVAADRMMSERPDIRGLWNHDSSQTIGRYSAKTLRYEKRTNGVWTEIVPPRWAAPYVESVARRDITGMSFAFMALSDDWWLEDGIPNREILDMEAFEFSGVSFPAYPTTTLNAVRGAERSRWVAQQTAERLRMAR